MKVTATTFVSVDGVMQGPGGPDEDRSGGFERGGRTTPHFDHEAATLLNEVYGRADAFLFGRPRVGRTQPTPSGVTIQVYRPTGRLHVGTSTADMKHVTR